LSLPRLEPLTLQPSLYMDCTSPDRMMEMDQEMSQLPVTRPFIIRHPSTPAIPLSSHGTMFIRFRCHNLHKSGESTGSAWGNTLLPPQTIFPQEPPCYISYSVFKPKTLSFKRPSRIKDLLVVALLLLYLSFTVKTD